MPAARQAGLHPLERSAKALVRYPGNERRGLGAIECAAGRGRCGNRWQRSFDGRLDDAQLGDGAVAEVGVDPLDDLASAVLDVDAASEVHAEHEGRTLPLGAALVIRLV